MTTRLRRGQTHSTWKGGRKGRDQEQQQHLVEIVMGIADRLPEVLQFAAKNWRVPIKYHDDAGCHKGIQRFR